MKQSARLFVVLALSVPWLLRVIGSALLSSTGFGRVIPGFDEPALAIAVVVLSPMIVGAALLMREQMTTRATRLALLIAAAIWTIAWARSVGAWVVVAGDACLEGEHRALLLADAALMSTIFGALAVTSRRGRVGAILAAIAPWPLVVGAQFLDILAHAEVALNGHYSLPAWDASHVLVALAMSAVLWRATAPAR